MQTSNDIMDTYLKIWAVIGPLLAAGISALWSRTTQIKDRDFNIKQEIEKEKRQESLKWQEKNEALRKEKYDEIKMGLASFMTSSHEYVRKQSEYITDPSQEKHKAASEANDKFVYSCQIVILLGGDDLANSATQFWNATLAIPKSYNIPIDTEYEGKLKVYKEARMLFNKQARIFLDSVLPYKTPDLPAPN